MDALLGATCDRALAASSAATSKVFRNRIRARDKKPPPAPLNEPYHLPGIGKSGAGGDVSSGQPSPRFERARASPLALGKEFVIFNHRGHGHLALVRRFFHPHDAPFALHPYTFRQRDFGREGQGEGQG